MTNPWNAPKLDTSLPIIPWSGTKSPEVKRVMTMAGYDPETGKRDAYAGITAYQWPQHRRLGGNNG